MMVGAALRRLTFRCPHPAEHVSIQPADEANKLSDYALQRLVEFGAIGETAGNEAG